ncbi:hypothetical protein RFI_21573 [Reticulomyxa filosa]|uniref:Uncharacterized protein n=1 Tax=Reticulomyxa filosa TaxID=46433 RepID=X6MQS0_RETFI|nr:hypothetical protein RFI_21573 [Reticulomyxa filosa]|eukprot:ETO15792.1 hypothetical protein RFI_21573 [Reticulomyxa filosa]
MLQRTEESPGWERQWRRYNWVWDFPVTTVQQGHKVVNNKEKEDARDQGAKLTFGEVLDCGVLLALHNLNARRKRVVCFSLRSDFFFFNWPKKKNFLFFFFFFFLAKSMHALHFFVSMTQESIPHPTLNIYSFTQTFLHCTSLTHCVGVELAKGRYELAEKNLKQLLKLGWRKRSFLRVEYKKGEFMVCYYYYVCKNFFFLYVCGAYVRFLIWEKKKRERNKKKCILFFYVCVWMQNLQKIVERLPNQHPNNGWKVGDECVAFVPNLRNDKHKMISYRARIVQTYYITSKSNPSKSDTPMCNVVDVELLDYVGESSSDVVNRPRHWT